MKVQDKSFQELKKYISISGFQGYDSAARCDNKDTCSGSYIHSFNIEISAQGGAGEFLQRIFVPSLLLLNSYYLGFYFTLVSSLKQDKVARSRMPPWGPFRGGETGE